MNFSAEVIFGVLAIVFILLSAKEYLSSGRVLTVKTKTWLRVAGIFILVIIFTTLIGMVR